jgi:hypothetical protein
MNHQCPWCGSPALDITTHDDSIDMRAAYLCAGPEGHRWRDGEGPDPVQAPEEPLIILATR